MPFYTYNNVICESGGKLVEKFADPKSGFNVRFLIIIFFRFRMRRSALISLHAHIIRNDNFSRSGIRNEQFSETRIAYNMRLYL